jgi:hypothetical protein
MITRVESSGVILKDICEIQTEKCVAKDSPAAITEFCRQQVLIGKNAESINKLGQICVICLTFH